MTDLLGFVRYPRKEADKERPGARIHHWHEYERIMPARQTCVQARRCMDCGTPCCHSHCPVHNLIPDWNLLVAETDWHRAWQQLESTNNFPEFTGRLCTAPCEAACTLSINSQPVTIRAIELAIIEHAWRAGWVRPQLPGRRRFQRVAIIGSGPAGLACAQQLARCGYAVTVYEQADQPGGLLRYGIPDFRLEKHVLDRRLAQLQAEGVRFRAGVHVDMQLFGELRRCMHAVVLACGATQPRELFVPGRHLQGIYPAMTYLERQNHCNAGDAFDNSQCIDAHDKVVAVIGGGDTGGDCIGTAIRQGARAVYQIQYHDRQPEHVDNLLYWPGPVPEWHSGDHDEEGCRHIWGYDTIAISGRNGRVERLVLQRLHWSAGADGSWRKQYVDGDVRTLDVQLVLLAMGYRHVWHDGLVSESGLQLDRCGNIAAGSDDYTTSMPGVYACGDARRGQSLVVWAIREGRQCARAVDRALSGYSELPCL